MAIIDANNINVFAWLVLESSHSGEYFHRAKPSSDKGTFLVVFAQFFLVSNLMGNIYNSIQENPDLIGDELNADMSSSFGGNFAFQGGEDVIDANNIKRVRLARHGFFAYWDFV